MKFLDKTHIYVGMASVAVILVYVWLMGTPMTILFLPTVLFLIAWQAVFGIFISWRYTPKNHHILFMLSYLQVMMGVFA